MNSKYKIKNIKNLYQGFFSLKEINFTHKKHNGDWTPIIKREIFGGANVSGVLPYDPIKKKILLLRQFRVGSIKRNHDPMMLEIVAGMIDENETPADAAKRECLEETGEKVKKLTSIYSYYPSPGSSESYYHSYLAEIDAFEGERFFGQENEHEDILVKSYSITEVRSFLKEKKIINALSILALQWFFLEYYKD